MEHNLGEVDLTRNQILRLIGLHNGNILGFHYMKGELIVVSNGSLSDSEKNDIKNNALNLPDLPPQKVLTQNEQAIKDARNFNELHSALLNYFNLN